MGMRFEENKETSYSSFLNPTLTHTLNLALGKTTILLDPIDK
jgi:hypothetical protein